MLADKKTYESKMSNFSLTKRRMSYGIRTAFCEIFCWIYVYLPSTEFVRGSATSAANSDVNDGNDDNDEQQATQSHS